MYAKWADGGQVNKQRVEAEKGESEGGVTTGSSCCSEQTWMEEKVEAEALL